jgi:multiple sugar transport system ATP-binding protein
MIYVTHDQVEAMTLGDRIAVLRRGLLQQVADPFTLYGRPANQFVAGFIGSPPINFFSAMLDETSTTLRSAGVSIPVPPAVAAQLMSRRGRALTLGIRPEDLLLEERGAGVTLDGVVDVREPLGNEVLVHLATPVGQFIARYPGQNVPAVGSKAKLHFSFAKLHCFDPDTELALKGAE